MIIKFILLLSNAQFSTLSLFEKISKNNSLDIEEKMYKKDDKQF